MFRVVGQQCYIRLHRAKSLTGFKLCAITTRNNIQQHTAGCANGRNMYHPTMLGVVGQQCCVRLQAALGLNPFVPGDFAKNAVEAI